MPECMVRPFHYCSVAILGPNFRSLFGTLARAHNWGQYRYQQMNLTHLHNTQDLILAGHAAGRIPRSPILLPGSQIAPNTPHSRQFFLFLILAFLLILLFLAKVL